MITVRLGVKEREVKRKRRRNGQRERSGEERVMGKVGKVERRLVLDRR